jgi:hypothetical protein
MKLLLIVFIADTHAWHCGYDSHWDKYRGEDHGADFEVCDNLICKIAVWLESMLFNWLYEE